MATAPKRFVRATSTFGLTYGNNHKSYIIVTPKQLWEVIYVTSEIVGLQYDFITIEIGHKLCKLVFEDVNDISTE